MENYKQQGRKPRQKQDWENVSVHLPENSPATKAAKEVAKAEGISIGTALRRLLERLLS